MKVGNSKVTFDVSYFEYIEYTEPILNRHTLELSSGCMDTRVFGDDVDTLEEALELLKLAFIDDPDKDWIITCDVVQDTGN